MHMLVWNPAWETGIARIDDQHRTLLGQVDQFFQAIHDPGAGDQLPGMLVFLAGYVDVHFREEEAAMEAAGYPGLPAHRTAHEGMRDRLKELLARFQEDRSVLTAALLEFMVDWLVNHIDQNDRVMAAYLLRSTGA